MAAAGSHFDSLATLHFLMLTRVISTNDNDAGIKLAICLQSLSVRAFDA